MGRGSAFIIFVSSVIRLRPSSNSVWATYASKRMIVLTMVIQLSMLLGLSDVVARPHMLPGCGHVCASLI